MDTDPLSDTVPPRYAFESDDEEDEPNPLHIHPNDQPSTVEIKIIGDVPKGLNLVVASGDAGKFWARGANLGEQTGAVADNGVQVGLIFNPAWTKSAVIISEALASLPLYAMSSYAEAIIDTLQPTRLSLLDVYPVPTYTTETPKPFHEAPIRYLSTLDNIDFLNLKADLFAPPNLIQSTSASFLSLLSLKNKPGTLILLPSPHIPRPAPRDINIDNALKLDQDNVEWSADRINTAQTLLFQSVGENVTYTWKPSKVAPEKPARRRTEVGEGGMYI